MLSRPIKLLLILFAISFFSALTLSLYYFSQEGQVIKNTSDIIRSNLAEMGLSSRVYTSSQVAGIKLSIKEKKKLEDFLTNLGFWEKGGRAFGYLNTPSTLKLDFVDAPKDKLRAASTSASEIASSFGINFSEKTKHMILYLHLSPSLISELGLEKASELLTKNLILYSYFLVEERDVSERLPSSETIDNASEFIENNLGEKEVWLKLEVSN